MYRTRTLAALAATALLVPAAAATANPDHGGHGRHGGDEKATDKVVQKRKAKKVKTVTYVFKGVYQGAGAVAVAKGNAHVKRAELVGKTVTFDFAAAKLVVADADANGVTLDDVHVGDRVVVQVRSVDAPRGRTDLSPVELP